MNLTSNKQVAFQGARIGAISLMIVSFLYLHIFVWRDSVTWTIVWILNALLYAVEWRMYLRALMRRPYDAEYRVAKESLSQTLSTLLPDPGVIGFQYLETVVILRRPSGKLVRGLFFVEILRDFDLVSDDESGKKCIAPHDVYEVSRSQLYVEKSFRVTRVNIQGDKLILTDDESELQQKSLLGLLWQKLRLSRQIPEDLLRASPDELRTLRMMLVEGELLVVSQETR